MKKVSTQAELKSALAGRRAVVLFHATWCPFCRSFRPAFDRLTSAVGAFTPVEVLLDDEDNPLWDELHIEAVPTVVFYDAGKAVRRLDAELGAGLDPSDLEAALGQQDAGQGAPTK